MMEIEFKQELNQCHDIRKSNDDMEKAFGSSSCQVSIADRSSGKGQD
jgi:hypothetical protein